MRQLSSEERVAFRRDGVIHLPGVIGPDLVGRMLEAVDQLMARPLAAAPAGTTRGGGMDRRLYASDPDWRELLHATPLARLAAEATGSARIRIYFDQVFVREAWSEARFLWHQDKPYWAVGGDQVVSTWLSLTSSTIEGSALEFVLGSHRWGRTYRPVAGEEDDQERLNLIWDGFGDRASTIPDQIIAFEEHPERFEVSGFAMEPGDALLFDYRILHRSRGNSTASRRVAISWRWLGDDATWQWERGADPVVGPDDTSNPIGALISDDEAFPIVYQRQG